jgi:hypothetical protein
MIDWPSPGYWILDDEKRLVKTDLMTWAKFFESRQGIVAKTAIDDVRVSTIFLGIDHNFGSGPPLLFETMIFGGEHDQHQERCSTWKQAEEQHERACALVRGHS